MGRILTLSCAVLLAAAACGDDSVEVAAPGSEGPTDTRYTATATVLESTDHGPQLCLGGVADSLPPQCGGPDIVGWDWGEVDGAESVSGTTWGQYRVVGTFDGDTFTLTEPAVVAGPDDWPDDGLGTDFSTPCPEPEGGWPVAAASGTDAVRDYAEAQPDFAGLWLDYVDPPVDSYDLDAARPEYDGAIVNVAFTGDLDRHRAELAARWDGPICVVQHDHTEADLRSVLTDLTERGDFLHGGVDIVANRAYLYVVLDDGTLQDELDAAHGPGLVEVHSALRPVED